jgi:PAS domain S-box-containing protein
MNQSSGSDVVGIAAESQNDFPVAASIPDGIASLDSILCTEELRRRPWRPPDYEKENRALAALASALVDSQSNILQILAETILEVTQCDSSGLSLLTKEDGGKGFYWPAIAGMWSPHVGGGTPREFGPCGDVLDRNHTLLFQHFERRYPYLLPVIPAAEECLLVPFYVGGEAVGTIWAIMHSDRRRFDAEDERLMSTLGQFASLAYQALASIEDLKLQITAREKAEAAVRELASGLEVKIRRLIDANIMGIFVWNCDGKIVEANEAFLGLVGYDREDLASGRLRWRELTPAEWSGADDRRVSQLEATGTAQPYEKEYFRKNGSRVPVLVGAATFEGSSDEGVAFVLDLTDRKKADEALRESEARTRLIVDTALDAVMTIDEQGFVMEWNAQAERMFGWRYDEAVGRRVSELLIPPRYRTAHENGLRHFLDTGAGPLLNRRVEITALRQDGGEFPVELSVAPYRAGEAWRFSGFVRDITQRKRAEEALRASELRWRTMFEKFPVGIVLRDAEQRYMAANPAFQKMVGYSEQELTLLSPLDITHEDDRLESERMLAELQAGARQSVEKEKRFRHKDGTVVWTMVSTFCIPEAGPIPAFYPAIVVDITKRKQAEEALRVSELELARISRLTTMGELAASIAHELRQPLSAAVTNGTTCQHWLSEATLDLARARAAAQRMIAAAQRTSEVMDRIRALTNKMPPQRGVLAINDLLRETLVLMETELRARRIVVATDLAEPPPAIIGDRVQLQQVVLNLIMNGAEAMSLVADRPRLLRISSRRQAPDSVLVAVEDSGTGLDPAIAEKIFDPFFTTKAGGMGMGLSICRSIIDGHGGRLWASPAPSHGALVQFTLPTDDSLP